MSVRSRVATGPAAAAAGPETPPSRRRWGSRRTSKRRSREASRDQSCPPPINTAADTAPRRDTDTVWSAERGEISGDAGRTAGGADDGDGGNSTRQSSRRSRRSRRRRTSPGDSTPGRGLGTPTTSTSASKALPARGVGHTVPCWYLGRATVEDVAVPSTAKRDCDTVLERVDRALFASLQKLHRAGGAPTIPAQVLLPREDLDDGASVVRASDITAILVRLSPTCRLLTTRAKPFRRLVAVPTRDSVGAYDVLLFPKSDTVQQIASALDCEATARLFQRPRKSSHRRSGSPRAPQPSTDSFGESIVGGPPDADALGGGDNGNGTDGSDVNDADTNHYHHADSESDSDADGGTASPEVNPALVLALQAAGARYSEALTALEVLEMSGGHPRSDSHNAGSTVPSAGDTGLPRGLRKITGSPPRFSGTPSFSASSDGGESVGNLSELIDLPPPSPVVVRRRRTPRRAAPIPPRRHGSRLSDDMPSVRRPRARVCKGPAPDIQMCHLLADLTKLVQVAPSPTTRLEYRNVEGYRRLCLHD